MIKIIAFLGNYGAEYRETRHNIGWLLADYLPFAHNLEWKSKFKGLYAQYAVDDQPVIFLKPQTLMNNSGESVSAVLHFYKCEPENLLVVHDEIEMAFGQIGLKKGGGAGGHNGLRSIVGIIGSPDFYRFRLGVSRPTHANVSAYVLSKFSPDEKSILPEYLTRSAEILQFCLVERIDVSLEKFKKYAVI